MCWFVGTAVVETRSFEVLEKSSWVHLGCGLVFCCFGAGWNRKKLREYFKIKGSLLKDIALYMMPLCCFASAQEYKEVLRRKEKKSVILQQKAVNNIKKKFEEKSRIDVAERGKNKGYEESEEEYLSEAECLNELKQEEDENSNHLLENEEKKVECLVSEIEEQNFSEEIEDFEEISQESEENNQILLCKVILEQDLYEDSSISNNCTGVEPLDGKDPEIYSYFVGAPPFSFAPNQEFDRLCPPPTYLPYTLIDLPQPTHQSLILKGMDFHKEGGLICVDYEALNRQKGVISDLIKKFFKSLTNRMGVATISLPIRVFEPRSTCERMIDRFSYAPIFLEKAGSLTSPIDRMLHTIAFHISGLHIGITQEKPFNPLLGETFQGYFEDGTEIYVEHTSHHPPIDCFDFISPSYRMWGYSEVDGTISGNSLVGHFKGVINILFNDGQLISMGEPKIRLGGMIWGNRTLNWEGEFEFRDQENGLYAAVRIGDDKKKWRVTNRKMSKDSLVGKVWKFDYENNEIGECLASIEGSWLKDIVVFENGKEEVLWKVGRDLRCEHHPLKRPLPSDWRYREDLVWLKRGKEEIAGRWKDRLEIRQREDRLLREKKKIK